MAIKRYPTAKPFPFSDAVSANGFIFLSGHVSMNCEGQPIYGTVSEQCQNIMESIRQTLEKAGTTLDSVVKVTVWLSDMVYFSEFNSAYSAYFKNGYPARSVTTSSLAFGLDVEIEVMALAP